MSILSSNLNIAHQVRPGWNVPVNAILTTLLISALLYLIIIGSSIAFNVIASLSQVGLISSYIVCIGCMLRRRLVGEPLHPSRFSLGRYGIYVNATAILFLILAFCFLFWPAAPSPTPASMNWSSLMFGAIVIFSMIYYYLYARHVYVGPVEYVKQM